jgi:hypothetical protein
VFWFVRIGPQLSRCSITTGFQPQTSEPPGTLRGTVGSHQPQSRDVGIYHPSERLDSSSRIRLNTSLYRYLSACPTTPHNSNPSHSLSDGQSLRYPFHSILNTSLQVFLLKPRKDKLFTQYTRQASCPSGNRHLPRLGPQRCQLIRD